MNRNAVGQLPPDDDRDYSTFPVDKTFAEQDRVYYRAHSVDYAPWYFGSTGLGRFDLNSPNGTMYLADDLATAVRERLATNIEPTQQLPESSAALMRVSSTRNIGRTNSSFANVSAEGTVMFGVTREMCTMLDYSITQRWAAKLFATGFDGVRYSSRFTTTPSPNSWAYFGSKGSTTMELVETWEGEAACELAGLTLIGPQSSSRLRKI